MGKQRAALDFDADTETPDVQELAGKGSIKKYTVDPETVQEVAEESGFPSREAGRQCGGGGARNRHTQCN